MFHIFVEKLLQTSTNPIKNKTIIIVLKKIYISPKLTSLMIRTECSIAEASVFVGSPSEPYRVDTEDFILDETPIFKTEDI